MTPIEKIVYMILSELQTYVFLFFSYYLYTKNDVVWMLVFVFMTFLSMVSIGARLNEWYGKIKF